MIILRVPNYEWLDTLMNEVREDLRDSEDKSYGEAYCLGRLYQLGHIQDLCVHVDLDLLREELATIEHIQWAAWAEAKDPSHPLLKVPYNDLSEADKDKDREWADRVLTAWLGYAGRVSVGQGANRVLRTIAPAMARAVASSDADREFRKLIAAAEEEERGRREQRGFLARLRQRRREKRGRKEEVIRLRAAANEMNAQLSLRGTKAVRNAWVAGEVEELLVRQQEAGQRKGLRLWDWLKRSLQKT